MVVYHISHHDPWETYRVIHASHSSPPTHGSSTIGPEMVTSTQASRAGKYDIETGSGHCNGCPCWELKRRKVQRSYPELDPHSPEVSGDEDHA